MLNTISYQDILKENGYFQYNSCKCGGVWTQKIKKEALRCYIMPNKQTYALFFYDKQVRSGHLKDLATNLDYEPTFT